MMIKNHYVFCLFAVLLLLLPTVGVGTIQKENFFNAELGEKHFYVKNSTNGHQKEYFSHFTTMKKELIRYEKCGTKPYIEDTPVSFNWKSNNGDWTTKAKNQGGCGSCWAFAALGILESKINIKENNPDLDPDLSEQYILSCLSNAGSCRGGNPSTALQLIMDASLIGNGCNGVPFESCMPYVADDMLPCEEKSEDWIEKLVPITSYDTWTSDGSENDRQRIKSQIQEDGPVITGIFADDDFTTWGLQHHNNSEYFAYDTHTIWSNHVIMIVGWHDDSSIDKGGYWICKNSWGPFWGYDGFFNIEYGAKGIDHGYVISVDYDAQSFDWPPVARIQGPYYSKANESLLFSAQQSFDVEGELLDYYWDFGDGQTAEGLSAEHLYETEGIYRLTLTVTDGVGKTDIIERAVMIQPWNLGDQWTYQFPEVMMFLDQDDISIMLQAEIPSVTFELTDESAEYYHVDFLTSIDGELIISFAEYTVPVTVKETSFSGSIKYSKKDLSIQDVQLDIGGKFRIGDVFPFALLFPGSIHLGFSFSKGINYIQFPLYESKSFDVSCSDVSVQGKVISPLFTLLNFANTLTGFFGKDFLPREIAEILPEITVDELLSLYGLDDRLRTPYISDLKVNEEIINTPAGLFSAYAIKKKNFGEISYAADVQNLVKINLSVKQKDFLDAEANIVIQGSLVSSNK